jgi:hypothetical protein
MKASPCHVLTIIDGETEELSDAYEISGFQLTAFLQQFDVPIETDPEMLDRYAVGPDDADFVIKALGFEMPFDFTRYAYFIEAAENDT